MRLKYWKVYAKLESLSHMTTVLVTTPRDWTEKILQVEIPKQCKEVEFVTTCKNFQWIEGPYSFELKSSDVLRDNKINLILN